MYNLVSLWDSAYSLKGRTLINSLAATCGDDFTIYVVALDNDTYDSLPLIDQVVGIHLADMEDSQLLKIKDGRTPQEYAWTLSSNAMKYVFEEFEPASLAYIDSDLFFFKNPKELYAEIGNASVAAIPHRFKKGSPEEARCLPNGIYNVSWIFAKNDADGRGFVEQWAMMCRDWCFYRNEPNKFADQYYIQLLLPEYCGHTVEHLGANLAPFNQLQYAYSAKADGLYISDDLRTDPLIFYHVHELLHDPHGNITRKTNWPLHPFVEKYVYGIYEDCLKIEVQESKVG